MNGPINEFLCQETDEKLTFEDAYEQLARMFAEE
jgi:flagellar biosynthesis/type III secretory pathway ATPase